MSEDRPTYDDELDLFAFFETIWNGKWIISTFIVIAALLGGSFIFVKDAVYESKLTFVVDIIPPFYRENKNTNNTVRKIQIDKVLNDYKKIFYSKKVFEGWKKNIGNSPLVFEDFSLNEVVDGFVILKSKDEQLITLSSEKENRFILVKSNQFIILENTFKYSTYVNELLKRVYLVRAKEELKRFNNSSLENSGNLQSILPIDRFIVSINERSGILMIQRPTIPKKVSPKSSLILVISVVLGVMVGVVYVLVSHSIRKRKDMFVKV